MVSGIIIFDEDGCFCSGCGNTASPIQVTHASVGDEIGCRIHFIAKQAKEGADISLFDSCRLPTLDTTFKQRNPKRKRRLFR